MGNAGNIPDCAYLLRRNCGSIKREKLKAQLVRALCESTRTVHADSDSLLSHLEELSSVKEKDPLALLRNVE